MKCGGGSMAKPDFTFVLVPNPASELYFTFWLN